MNLGMTALEEGVSAVTGTPSVKLGTRRVDGNGHEYVYVYNNGLYQGWPGSPMCLNSSSSGYSVTLSNAASQTGVFAGTVHHATIPTQYYGWLMVRGASRVRPDSSTISLAVGDELALGIDGGFVALTGATLSTSTRKGVIISSMVTCSGASLASLGKGWIKSDIW